MPFCASCGSPVEGRFCGKCGAPAGAPAAESAAGPSPASNPASAAGLQENVASALCYLGGVITGIIFLVLEPYNRNRNIRFHAFQSIFLTLAWFVFWFAIRAAFGLLSLGLFVLLPLFSLAWFVLWIYMMLTAYQGRKVVLPVIGALAEQQA